MMIASVIEFVRRRFGYGFPPLGRLAFDLVFKLSPGKVRAELVPGVFADLDFSDEVQRATYWQGERFEYPTFRVLSHWVGEGATHFFDIGSNYGFFSFALLARHPKLRAHAFEPNPTTFAHLAQIKAQNALERLTVWNLGLSDQCSTLSLHRGLTDSGHSTFGEHPGLLSGAADSIEVLDFESWREKAGVALPAAGDWIGKIDVEGFEMKVLSGMRPALEARAFRGVVVEINAFTLEFCGFKPEQIYAFMKEVGYQPLASVTDSEMSPRRDTNEYFVPA